MMSPAGGRHGRVAFRIAMLLGKHVEEHDLGIVLAAETGFRVAENPDTVIAPDVAYVDKKRYAAIIDETKYIPFAPNLAVEVISPSDTFTQVETKAFLWLSAGTQLVLLVDCEAETIHAYRSRHDIHVVDRTESLDCQDAVPGWQLRVEEVFAK